MPIKIIDRWNLARIYLGERLDRSRVRDVVKSKSEKLSNGIFKDLLDRSPDGSKWDDPSKVLERRQRFLANRSPRPSERKFGITLKQGWVKPRIDFRGSTKNIVRSSINFINLAPHTEWVLDGVDKTYQIPGSLLDYRLYFFWNREGRIVAPKEITHKGFAGNPFVDDIIEESQTKVGDLLREIEEGLVSNG